MVWHYVKSRESLERMPAWGSGRNLQPPLKKHAFYSGARPVKRTRRSVNRIDDHNPNCMFLKRHGFIEAGSSLCWSTWRSQPFYLCATLIRSCLWLGCSRNLHHGHARSTALSDFIRLAWLLATCRLQQKKSKLKSLQLDYSSGVTPGKRNTALVTKLTMKRCRIMGVLVSAIAKRRVHFQRRDSRPDSVTGYRQNKRPTTIAPSVYPTYPVARDDTRTDSSYASLKGMSRRNLEA